MASYARLNINAHTNTHDKHLITIETSIHSTLGGVEECASQESFLPSDKKENQLVENCF